MDINQKFLHDLPMPNPSAYILPTIGRQEEEVDIFWNPKEKSLIDLQQPCSLLLRPPVVEIDWGTQFVKKDVPNKVSALLVTCGIIKTDFADVGYYNRASKIFYWQAVAALSEDQVKEMMALYVAANNWLATAPTLDKKDRKKMLRAFSQEFEQIKIRYDLIILRDEIAAFSASMNQYLRQFTKRRYYVAGQMEHLEHSISTNAVHAEQMYFEYLARFENLDSTIAMAFSVYKEVNLLFRWLERTVPSFRQRAYSVVFNHDFSRYIPELESMLARIITDPASVDMQRFKTIYRYIASVEQKYIPHFSNQLKSDEQIHFEQQFQRARLLCAEVRLVKLQWLWEWHLSLPEAKEVLVHYDILTQLPEKPKDSLARHARWVLKRSEHLFKEANLVVYLEEIREYI